MNIRTVLFDLDGTLADTALDLADALNVVRTEENLPPLPFDVIRPSVSHGGRAMIKLGFQVDPGHADFERLRLRFLAVYEANIARKTRLFAGMDELLDALEDAGLQWGVVTNKPAWLTDPLMHALALSERAACIVSGDTTAHAKPHPEPMFYACRQVGSEPAQCVYIGDAERDVTAGKAAGMRTIVALFGYIDAHEQPDTWGADALINHPLETLQLIKAWS